MNVISGTTAKSNTLALSKDFLEVEGSAVLITNNMGYGEFFCMVKEDLGIDLNEVADELANKHYFHLEAETNLISLGKAIIMHLEQGVENFFIDDSENTIFTNERFRDDIISLKENGVYFTVIDHNKFKK